MEKINQKVASLSVFKKLYDKNEDIYDVICDLIKIEIKKASKFKFSLFYITNMVNETNGFSIPEAIIKSSLNRLKKKNILKINSKIYTMTNRELINIEDIDYDENTEHINKRIIKYIQKRNSTIDEQIILKSIESYILGKNDEYNLFSYIELLIIDDNDVKDYINEINMGKILYEGISYGIEKINPKKWNEKVVFLSTDVLFHCVGYNGELYKKIFNDFIDLIKIVNKEKKIIELKYFSQTQEIIDDFFQNAENIISNKKEYKLNEAMSCILENCKTKSDIVMKKQTFYGNLEKLSILLYDKNDYSLDIKLNHQYNLKTKLDYKVEDIDKIDGYNRLLSNVNILRRGTQETTIDKVKYFLLTENRQIINLSIKSKKENNYLGFPLAISLFDIINQLWIKSNKSLNSNKPLTLDIINNAKISLSKKTFDNISKEYNKNLSYMKNNKIDENTYIEKMAELKNINTLPENITERSLLEVNNILFDDKCFDKYYEEKNHHKNESKRKDKVIKNQDEENKALKLKILKNSLKSKHDNKKSVIKDKRITQKWKKLFCYISIIGILIYHKEKIYNFVKHPIFLVLSAVASLISIYSLAS